MHNTKELQNRIKAATKRLRNSYYTTHNEEPIKPARAFGGKPTESIGAFAEYNLRGRHCPRSQVGLCTPCFYSKFPNIIDVSDYTELLIEQIDYLIDNFEESVLNKKSGEVYYKADDLFYSKSEPVALCITPVGSFFDEHEFSFDVRMHLLKRLVNISETLSKDIILYVETHVADFIHWDNSKTSMELSLMQRLHLRVVFGFESKNNFVRNVLYCKNIMIQDFEYAISLAKKYAFGTYAFVFAGLYPMAHIEILSDIKDTFIYLKGKDVVPVLMFANVQEYTIADLLVRCNYSKLINPITVLEVIKNMLDIFGRINENGCDAWLIADPVGGPPTPATHIFSGNEIECCSGTIYRMIRELRANHEYAMFDEEYRQVINCPTHKTSFDLLRQIPLESIEFRTIKMMDFVEPMLDNYISDIRAEELTVVKSTLLCQGVQANNEAKKAMKSLGISDGFIHSSNLLLDGSPVNACMMEFFANKPSCSITFAKGKFYLHYTASIDENPDYIGEIDFIRIPDWGNKVVSGYIVSDYLRPHSKQCISIWPNQICGFGKDKCRFCSLSGVVTLTPKIVLEMVDIALQHNHDYEVHLSGGVYIDIEENVNYYSEVASLIHNKHPATRISLETIPPLSLNDMQIYKKSGISSLIMNIEIADECVRRNICPGKSNISYNRYFEAYEEAVHLFGRWNVGSVILYGIEGVSNEQILNCAKKMCGIGVYPVIMPFQPLSVSALSEAQSTNPKSFLEISREVSHIVKATISNEPICKFGCLNCGACSVENYYLKENNYEHFNH